MSYKISGVVIKIGETEKKNDFSFRTFAIDTGGEFPQKVQFQTSNQMCSALDKISIGQFITLHFSLRGKEWNDKIITNINCYKIEGVEVGNSASPQSERSTSPSSVPAPDTETASIEGIDELPF